MEFIKVDTDFKQANKLNDNLKKFILYLIL